MPQSSDRLPQFLNSVQRETLRELFLHEASIVSCLYWRNTSPWEVKWRTCSDDFILVPTRGRIRAHFEGRSLTVGVGKFLIVPEGVRHAMEIARGERRLEHLVLHFHLYDRWRRSLLSRLPTNIGVLRDPKTTFQSLSELTCLLTRDPETGRDYGAMLIRNLLAQELVRHPLSLSLPHGDPRVSSAIEQMEHSLDSVDLSVETLARSLGLTSVQFRKIFRRDIGESPKEFLQSLRLRRASWLLRHTTASVKEIAAQCGFGSDHYFHLIFRRHHGMTPSEFRSGHPAEI